MKKQTDALQSCFKTMWKGRLIRSPNDCCFPISLLYITPPPTHTDTCAYENTNWLPVAHINTPVAAAHEYPDVLPTCSVSPLCTLPTVRIKRTRKQSRAHRRKRREIMRRVLLTERGREGRIWTEAWKKKGGNRDDSDVSQQSERRESTEGEWNE